MWRTLVLSVLLVLFLAACEGDPGPMGLPGPPGPGTIIVYEGDVPQRGEIFTVSVPEADIDNLPLIVVYVRDNADTWIQLNVVEVLIGLGELAIIQQGEVQILTQVGVKYRIIVIKE